MKPLVAGTSNTQEKGAAVVFWRNFIPIFIAIKLSDELNQDMKRRPKWIFTELKR